MSDQYDAATARLSALREQLTGSFAITPAVSRDGGEDGLVVLLHPWSDEVAERIRRALEMPAVEVVPGRASRGARLSADGATDDAFSVPGLVQDRLWRDGYWAHLNDQLDLFFDEYESEAIGPDDADRMAALTFRLAERYVHRAEDWAPHVHQALLDLAGYLTARRRPRTNVDL